MFTFNETNQFCDYEALFVYGYATCTICVLCGVFITYLGFRGFCCVRSDIKFAFKIGFMLQSLSQLIMPSIQIFLLTSCVILSDDNPKNSISYYGTFIVTFLYEFQIWISQIIIVYRLYYTFIDSIYRINKCVFSVIIISVVIELFIGFIGVLLFFIFDDLDLSVIVCLIGLLLYFIISIIIINMFVKRLFNVSSTSSQYIYRSSPDIKYEQINEHQSKSDINKSAAKYLTLGIIGFISTFLASLCTLMIYFCNDYSIISQLCGIMWCIDSLCNLICIFLQYSFAKTFYYTVCKCIDKKCQKWINRKVINKLSMDTQLNQHH